MALELLAVTDVSLAYLCVGGFVALFSLVSIFVREKIYINEVVLGTAFGILMGPHVANVINPRSWATNQNAITMEVTRVTLAIGLFAIGVGLPQRYLIRRLKSLLIMVVPTMAFGWLIIGAVIYIIFRPLDYVSALAIAACLTPTDPVVSAVIVDGSFAANRVPRQLRNIIKAESASNDGMAYPFISIALYLTLDNSYRQAFGDWLLVGWLYQVILGTVIGAINGFIFSFLMKKLIETRKSCMKNYHNNSNDDKKKNDADNDDDEEEVEVEACIGARTAQYIALTFFTIGIASSIGSDDLLAAFASGCAVSWDGEFKKETEDQTLPTVIDTVFNCACFVYIGAWMPFDSFTANNLGIAPWRLIVLLVMTLLFRRIPFLLLVYKWVPEIKTWQQALFAGHFGPMGVSAIFVSTLAERRLPTPHNPPESQAEYLAASLQPIIAFVVLGSIIVHGFSIPLFCICERMVSNKSKSLEQFSDANSICSTVNIAADANEELEPSKLGGEAV